MENRVFIFEDNQEHWSCIKTMLDEGGIKNYYPVNDKDFRVLKNCLQEFYSSIPAKKDSARKFLSENIKEDDFLLMDYILEVKDFNINCINIYIDLNLENKALIYTAMQSRHYSSIENEVKEKKLTHKIKIIMKPDIVAVYEIKDDIEFLCNNIREANNLNDLSDNTSYKKPPAIKPEG